jgi:hypothetical protein
LRLDRETCQVVTVTFVYVSGRRCLDFAGTRKRRRSSAPKELLTLPHALSDRAVQAGLLGVELRSPVTSLSRQSRCAKRSFGL